MTSERNNTEKPIWLLIDASNHCYRDWHAAQDRAADLFRRRIDLLMDRSKPSRVAVAFDSHESWRREFEPTYKANRDGTPGGVQVTLDAVRQWCVDNAIDVVETRGFEADDIIATLTIIGRERGNRIVISSADKDVRQLLDLGCVSQLTSVKRTGDTIALEWMTATRLVETFGIEPWQWVDYQTIVGDSTDNIVGAQNIGEKIAVKILKACHSLDAYYRNRWPANLTRHQYALMDKFRPRYQAVRKLVTLRRDVPLPAEWFETAEA